MESLSCTFDPGHLIEALVHFNEALDRLDGQYAAVDVADVIFRCLNKFQTGRLAAEGGEVAGFVEMVRFATQTQPLRSRFLGAELRAFAALQPQVMDHSVLRHGGYRPGSDIEPRLLTDATAKHHKLVNAIRRLDTEATAHEAIDQVIKRSAELLYIVRSNIAHGEKTPYGPDLAKRERDERVCRLVVPLCEVLVDLLLDQPSRRLVAYGTLAPGQVNHGVVDSLDGQWRQCTVEASLTEDAGLPVLSWQPGVSAPLEAMLLESEDLPNHWQRLDAFEGSAYRRRLVPVSVRNTDGASTLIVASAYLGS